MEIHFLYTKSFCDQHSHKKNLPSTNFWVITFLSSIIVNAQICFHFKLIKDKATGMNSDQQNLMERTGTQQISDMLIINAKEVKRI